jgi:hypothetical protein
MEPGYIEPSTWFAEINCFNYSNSKFSIGETVIYNGKTFEITGVNKTSSGFIYSLAESENTFREEELSHL